MAPGKDRGDPTGLPGKETHYTGSIEGWGIQFHGIGRVWPPFAWRRCQVGCGGPDPLLCSPRAAVCTFRARRVNRSPWGTWVSLFFGRSLSQQWDIRDSAAQATMEVSETHRIRCTDDLRRLPRLSTQAPKHHTLPPSQLLSPARHRHCCSVCCPLSRVCSLRSSKCLLCPLTHVHWNQCRGWAFPARSKGDNLPLVGQTSADGH